MAERKINPTTIDGWERQKRLERKTRKPRPEFCPNCSASVTHHTGEYCHECGETLGRRS